MKTWKEPYAVFSKIKKPYGFLSNMSKHSIKFENILFPTSEHLYQSLKFADINIVKHIASISNPVDAKREAYKFEEYVRSDWMDVRIDAMMFVISLKSKQHSCILETLKKLDDSVSIIELSYRDSFWGAKPDDNLTYVGDNMLGVCWMRLLRDEPSIVPFSFESVKIII